MSSKPQTYGPGPDFKYLGFVYDSATYARNAAFDLYTYAKNQTPENIKGQVNNFEQKAVELGKPYTDTFEDFGTRLLKDADFRLSAFGDIVLGYRGDGEKLLQRFKERRGEFIKQLQDQAKEVRSKNPELATRLDKNVEELKKLPEYADARTKETLNQLKLNLDSLRSDPRVNKAYENIRPQIEQGQKVLEDSQTKVLADQRYANLFNFVSYHVNNILSSKTVQDVKVTVQPYANKVISEERQTQIYDTVVKNITPTTTPTNDPKTGQTKTQ